MSEWLTTGFIIDHIAIGEIAQAQDRIKKECITRTGNGIYWCNEHGQITYGDVLIINDVTLNMKWKFMPKYVSFEEAKNAIKEGKYVNFHPEENTSLSVGIDGSLVWFEKYTWRQLFEGKWTIAE